VLVVDDNPVIRQIVCELFTRDGEFEVCGQAENGQEAVEKARRLRPALIVTDLAMPLMDGLEETRILKELMPSVPVIIYTAHSDPFVDKEAPIGRGIRRHLQIRCCSGSGGKSAGTARQNRRLTKKGGVQTRTPPEINNG